MEKAFKKIVTIFAYLLICTIIALTFLVPTYKESGRRVDFFSSLEIVDNIKNLEMNMTTIIYAKDKDGNWQEYRRLHGDENRIWVSIDKMPDKLKNAFIAIEDETFNDHSGINWRRTMGAIGNFFFEFDEKQFGGSTITQQLIKNITSDNDRSANRKIREIIRAMIIEQNLKKEEILEAYLNTIALGNGINGVQVAANNYFNKDVSELTLLESVCIAAITQNPTKYNPITNMEKNKERRNTVLDKMLELGMITESEHQENYDVDITLDQSKEENLESDINNYFVDALIEQVIDDFAEKFDCSEQMASTMLYNGGYQIYSTVNPEIQETMEDVYTNTKKYFNLKGKNANGETVHVQSAMTIMDYEGHIVGLVGGAGEKLVNRGLNRAVSSPRQPGSTMKPIGVYTLAIENDIVHYSSKVLDEPIKNYYPDGKSGPAEWYGEYKGYITVDYALRKSANTIPVRLLQEVGIDNSYDFLTKKLGFKYLKPEDKNLASLALGGCVYGVTTTESAAAYAIYGNGGVYHKPSTYYKIERVGGEVVIDYDETGEQVISPATATIMNHLLQGVVSGSEGTGAGIRWYHNSMKAYAKTGTSSESKDLWMVAGTPYYVGSVWYGFDRQQEIHSTSAAATVWKAVMTQVHKNLEKKTFTDSEDVYKKGSGYYKNGTKPDNIVYKEPTVSSTVSSTTPDTTTSTPVTSTPTTSTPTESTVTSSTPVTSTPESPPVTSTPTPTESTPTTPDPQPPPTTEESPPSSETADE